MAETNFGTLLTEQKTVWQRKLWTQARQHSFVMSMAGTDENAAIHRITELTTDERGSRAVMTLVPDLTGDGTMGDADLEGREEAGQAHDIAMQIDQIRHAMKSKGRITEQKTVVKFRQTAQNLLSFWMADRVDQMAMLTLSGLDYRFNTDGSLRAGFSHNGTVFARDTGVAPVGYALFDLEYAADVTAPSTNRHFRWNGATKELAAGDTTAVAVGDTLSYAALVELKAHMKDKRLKPIRTGNGVEVYHVWVHPKVMAKLKLDPDFLASLQQAGQRGPSNPIFSGTVVTVDGLVISEYTHVFNTLGATTGAAINAGTPGFKWGTNANVDGARVLMLGAQALGVADIGVPEWDERDHFDYGNKPGIATNKITGFKKPVFHSNKDGGDEDFGVAVLDVALKAA